MFLKTVAICIIALTVANRLYLKFKLLLTVIHNRYSLYNFSPPAVELRHENN